jgi:hypothetical protein
MKTLLKEIWGQCSLPIMAGYLLAFVGSGLAEAADQPPFIIIGLNIAMVVSVAIPVIGGFLAWRSNRVAQEQAAANTDVVEQRKQAYREKY